MLLGCGAHKCHFVALSAEMVREAGLRRMVMSLEWVKDVVMTKDHSKLPAVRDWCFEH